MQLGNDEKDSVFEAKKLALALKAARLKKGLTRKSAAAMAGCSINSIEQLENARCKFTQARIEKIAMAYGYSVGQFADLKRDPKRYLSEVCKSGDQDKTVERKPRRNHFKIVTKEVRVLRLLRKKKGISQYEASRLCGYANGGFGHLEVGRIEITRPRVEHILKCLGYKWADYEALLNAPVLRDEIIEQAIAAIYRLDDQALSSVFSIIKSLTK